MLSNVIAGRMTVSVDLPQGFDLSKEDEIELFGAICDAVPRWSYLRGIFDSLRVDVETTIRNDYTTLARDTGAEISRLLEERDRLRDEVKTRSDELKRKEDSANRAISRMQTMREELREIVRDIKTL